MATRMNTRTRVLKLLRAGDSCWRNGRRATASVSRKTKRPCFFLTLKNARKRFAAISMTNRRGRALPLRDSVARLRVDMTTIPRCARCLEPWRRFANKSAGDCMIFDLAQSDQIPSFAADVCIVGAGAAGIVLTGELVRQGRRVLLLESGGRKEEEAIQQLNNSVRTGQPLKAVHPGRFRSLGGSTTHWGGQISEFEKQDFEVQPGIPGSGWPISKSVLQPYYQRAQQAE